MNICCAINSYGSLSTFNAVYRIALYNQKIFFFTSIKIKKNKLLKNSNIKYIFLNEKISENKCKDLLNHYKITTLICGTNGNNFFEYIFCKSAKKKIF